MTRVVIEQWRILFAFFVSIIILFIAVSAYGIYFRIWWAAIGLFFAFIPFFLRLWAIPFIEIVFNNSKKEAIVIEESGLTFGNNIRLGPIPWEYIVGAEITGKVLRVDINDKRKLAAVLGERALERVYQDKKTGKEWVQMSIRFLKLRGTDLAAMIRERATGLRPSG